MQVLLVPPWVNIVVICFINIKNELSPNLFLDWNTTMVVLSNQKNSIDNLMTSNTSSATNNTLSTVKNLLQQLEASLQAYLTLIQSRISIPGLHSIFIIRYLCNKRCADCNNASLQLSELDSLDLGYSATINNVTTLAENELQTWRTNTLAVCQTMKEKIDVERSQLQSC